MFKTTQDTTKTAVWVIIAVVAIALAVFSGYKSFIAPQQGRMWASSTCSRAGRRV